MIELITTIEEITDWWITKQTGLNRHERAYEEWYKTTVNYRASDITDMFKNFEHVVIVNPEKFFDMHEPFGWVPVKDAKQYFWPQRSPGLCSVWRFERVFWNNWEWSINELGGADKVFVASNNSEDAMMIALKYS